MAGILKRILDSVLFTKRSKTLSRATKRRSLRLESLEMRQTMDASIPGIVYTDANDNGTREVSEPLLGGVQVSLYRDGGDNIFNNGTGDDTLVDTDTTPASGINQGRYNLIATQTGTHFVVQDTAVTGQVQRASQRVRTVNVTSVTTQQQVSIDSYGISTALFTADSGVGGTNPNFATTTTAVTTDIVGGVRDLHANATTGALTVAANLSSTGVLDFGNSSGGQGVYLATYDGDATNAPNLLGTELGSGTNNFDMTAGGSATFIRIALAAEANLTGDATLTIRGRDNDSTDVLLNAAAIPERATPTDPLLFIDVPFSSFPAGFDETQVGALQFEISNQAGQQVVIDNIGLFGDPVLAAQNIANLNPMTIGNQVFRDINSNGLLDGSDAGIGGVTVQLYVDTDANGSLSPSELSAQPSPQSTTTSATAGTLGQYSFTNLLPGSYVVLVPASQFNASAPLDNLAASIIPASPPANNGNTGVFVTGLGVASAVTLVAGAAPVTDGDTDANTNLSRDFGFAPPTLTITKDDSPNTARVGENLTYTIAVTNNSPLASGIDSTNTVVTDTLPTGLTIVGTPAFTIANPTGTSGSATFNTTTRQVSAPIGTLVPGQTATLIVIATVGATFVNPTTNTANAANAEGSTVQANVTTPAAPNVDLGITKTIVGGATSIPLGGGLTYRLTVTNNSSVAVTGVTVNDDLPAGFVPGTLPTGVAAGTAPADLVWTIGNLGANGTATIDIPVTVPITVTPGSFINAASIVVANQTFTDLVLGNNQAQVSVDVTPRYDLRVTKTNNLTTLATGQTFTYTITAINDGPSTASNVTVSDTLPASLEFVSSTVGSVSGQQFTANLGNVLSAGTAPVNVVVRVRPSATGTSIVNTATVTADNASTQERDAQNNPATANNTASDTDPLTRAVTLVVRKDSSAATAVAGGSNFNYTIIAVNSGTADTTGVNISDPLPTGIEFVSGTFTLDDGSNTSGNVSFNTTTRTVSLPSAVTLKAGGSLGSGTTASVNEAIITLIVRAGATAAAGTATNVVTLTSADNTAGVTDDAPVTINRDFDVTVTKVGSASSVVAGQALNYTIVVTNTGVSTATNVVVSDPLPTTLNFVSATSGFTNTSGTVGGTIASLAAGASTTITIGTTVKNDTPNATAINNQVVVTAAGESNPNNNSATAAATVVSTAKLSGRVYIDSNNNGTRDTSEVGIRGVTMNLTGTSSTGTAVTRTTTTDANGEYTFDALPVGTYTVLQVQPGNFRSRSTNVGTVNGVSSGTGTDNQIAAINLTADSIANEFGELLILSKRSFLASSAF